MKILKYILTVVVVLALITGLSVCLYVSFTKTLSANECLMVGIMVSIFSILISWIVTHVYSQMNLESRTEEVRKQHEENIRTYAVKAAEKVFNLSGELNRLIENLKSVLEDYDEEEGIEVYNLVLRERIISTIYLVETLKSMNDTFLSDWKGVIGEQIQQQQNLEKQIKEIAEEVERQKRIKEQLESQFVSYTELEEIEHHIRDAEKQLYQKVLQLPFRARPVIHKPKKQDILVECPACESNNLISIRPRAGARKAFQCKECEEHLKVIYETDTEFEIEKIPLNEFSEKCPLCRKEFRGCIPAYPGAMKNFVCPECACEILVTKKKDGVNVGRRQKQRDIPEKLLDRIYQELPPQPWDKDIHKVVAEKLGLSNSLVHRAIKSLLSQGKVAEAPSDVDEGVDKPEEEEG